MKKLGYRKEFAGGVEAAASTGGQLMPPIMGAAAFLMVEFIGGITYWEIAKAATIPAILYFTGIWIMTHFEAKRVGLKGMSEDQIPDSEKSTKENLLTCTNLRDYCFSFNWSSNDASSPLWDCVNNYR